MHRSVPLLALAVLTAGCAGSSTPSAVDQTPQPSASADPATPSSPAAGSASPSSAGTSARAIYYLRDTTNGPRLYREFHRRPATTGVVRDAVTAMLTEPPQDEDYTSLWAKGTRVLGVRMEGSTAVVDLSKEAQTVRGGAAFESSTLQQLVWTATAADPHVTSVQLLVEGKRVDSLWGHVDTSRPMTRGQAAIELAPVWILTPANGRVARGGTFGGEASVFEATVSWELRQGGKVVKAGFTNAAMGAPGRGPWSAKADIPPGDYVLRAFESSAKDGSETFVDDKPLTVT
ncbi:MAG: GerMN domain-containing protein [Frankiaceae bacterium]|nr:GerMN domain-containing protein [Frankiaceae bacterium]